MRCVRAAPTSACRLLGVAAARHASLPCPPMAQTKSMATRIRKQYDDLRTEVVKLTKEVQEAQAELQILDKMASAHRSQDAVRMTRDMEVVEQRCVATRNVTVLAYVQQPRW